MGQRHQIYLVLPKESNRIQLYKDFEEKEMINSHIIPMHHQWLYGQTAIKQLMYFLKYCKGIQKDIEEDGKGNCYHPFVSNLYSREASDVFTSLYSTNPEGYWHNVCIEPYSLVEDPRNGDNNDGITIIDLQDIMNPKYCMMYLYDDEELEAYEPINALKYVHHYYPEGEIHYRFTADESKEYDQENLEIANEVDKIATLMTTEEVLALFPTLKQEEPATCK